MVLFFVLLMISIFYFALNVNRPKRLYCAAVFYIPLSFRSLSGSLSMYLIVFLFLILTFFHRGGTSNPQEGSSDTVLIYLLLIVSALSALSLPPIFNSGYGRIRLSGDYLSVLTMFSCVGVYQMAKRFVSTRQDLIRLLKVMVFSGSIATLAGYLQLINPANTLIFKYIVIAENVKWAKRIAATMPGYELLSEYTVLMILFSYVLILDAKSRKGKLLFGFLILNFLAILPLTQTRGIYVAIALGLVYLIALMFLMGRIGASIKAFICSFAVIALLVGTIFAIDILRPDSQFVERLKPENIHINIGKGKFDTRTPAWLYGVELIKSTSAMEKIIGTGYKYFGKGKGKMKVTGWPHSLYLSYILRDGFLGLFVLLTFFTWLYYRSIKSMLLSKTLEDTFWLEVSTILHVGLIIFFVNEMKIEFIRHDRSQNIIWLFFAVIAVTSAMIRREAISKSENDRNRPIQALV